MTINRKDPLKTNTNKRVVARTKMRKLKQVPATPLRKKLPKNVG